MPRSILFDGRARGARIPILIIIPLGYTIGVCICILLVGIRRGERRSLLCIQCLPFRACNINVHIVRANAGDMGKYMPKFFPNY